MKTLFKFTVIALALQLACCKELAPGGYVLKLPDVPAPWTALLGEPCWKLEWLEPDGQKRTMEILPGERTRIEIPVTWANPVTAWPFWPEYKLIPGCFKPAGALFPFDAYGGDLCLSWEAGVDTVFYWELALANKKDLSKIPANFDWLRFRELFETSVLNEAVCKDPWLPDWRYIAEKTIESSFDRRRIVAQSTQSVAIPVGSGPWYGASPFAEPLIFKEGEAVFPVSAGINVWVSAEGVLRINGNVWAITPIATGGIQ